jgi:hypothetical protein
MPLAGKPEGDIPRPRAVYIRRFHYSATETIGTLYYPELQLYTVEPPWRNNEPRVSCIPCGTYYAEPAQFYRGGYATWQLKGVPGRTLIKLHIANFGDELMGCIAPGTELLLLNKKLGVANSRTAFYEMRRMLPTDGQIMVDIGNAWTKPGVIL